MMNSRGNYQTARSYKQDQNPSKMQLLREVLEAVMWEFSAIRERRWEELPELSVKKKQLLNRMSEFDWTPLPADRENPELSILKAQIIDLEYQIKQSLEVQLGIVETQLEDLKTRHNRWRNAIKPYRAN